MRVPTPKTDLWISFISVALLGASRVIGADPTHHLETWAFWGGIGGLGLLAVWHVLALAVNLIRGSAVEAKAGVDNRGGAYIGGDNSGTQQIVHGDLTINHAPTPSAAPPEPPPRDFVQPQVTPARIMAHFNGKTEMQGLALVKPLYGKWMRVAGRVAGVSDYIGLYQVTFMPPGKKTFSLVNLFFEETWKDHLHSLKHGDKITVVGVISHASPLGVSLRNCEIEQKPRGLAL